MDYKLCSVRFDLQGIRNVLVDVSVKEIERLNHNEISRVFHCDGLVLCFTKYHENEKVLLWNPYLGQTRLIERNFKTTDKYALGYDSNGSHKMLKFFYCQPAVFEYEIYDFSSHSWKVLSITCDWSIPHHQLGGMSLKGNAYFVVKDLLPLPFHSYTYGYPVTVTLSCAREEHLAVLNLEIEDKILEIWVTNKI
ncbi:hypothetical protein HID58_067193 [Brassica napus]|uniref:F-box associated beta-propeller type 1 domain-containing protein n=1 Tax=Brassica napus TaxID=3708 RepID=A0ABQ7ZHU3_BRANA|nr:hypothetical protein HID58_067193 [Brassica napus]